MANHLFGAEKGEWPNVGSGAEKGSAVPNVGSKWPDTGLFLLLETVLRFSIWYSVSSLLSLVWPDPRLFSSLNLVCLLPCWPCTELLLFS